MARTRRRFVGAVAASTALALAGCTSSGSGGSGGQQDTTTTASMDTTTTATGPTVAVRDHAEHGEILVDGEGVTLYMFDSDSRGAGKSTCYDSCADAWPPLTGGNPATGDGVTATLSTFERTDGATQVAANGWPLYYYASDSSPGDATGQGVGDAWWVLAPDGTPKRGGTTTTTTSDGGDTTTTTDGYDY